MGRARRSSPPSPRRSQSMQKRSAPSPATVRSQPPAHATQSSSSGVMSGLMGTVAQGMAFGTGSAVAHRAVGAVASSFGGSDNKEEVCAAQHDIPTRPLQAPQNTCSNDQEAFLKCLQSSANDISACQFHLDAFNQCKQQSAFM